MKLYLSSYRIPDPEALKRFVGKDDIKIGLVLNSKDYKSKEDREEKWREVSEYFPSLGLSIQEIDLRTYKDRDTLKNALESLDVIWFLGGNTYCLRWAIEQSPATKEMLRDVFESGVIYAGDSAGAIIAGPTLKYFDSADDPTVVPETLYDGLGFVDFVVVPHWGSEDYGDLLNQENEKLEKDGYKTMPLRDNEFILVDGDEVIQGSS